MWDYTEKVLDHFKNPRNVGKIEHPDGVGQVGSLACGDALVFMFKLGPDGRVAEAKFQTFGCASAIASSSALTEMVIGKTLDEAGRITNRQIADYLGGLPSQKMHCSVMGREALEAAIHNHRTGETAPRHLDDAIACTCFGVPQNDILRVIRENNLDSVEEIANFTKAGGGCGACVPELQRLLETARAERRAPPPAAAPKAMTNLQRMRLVEEVIERDIRPALQRDQGDVELIDIQGNRVTIAFRGHCAGCRSAGVTRDAFIAAKLRECVDPDIEVVEE